MHEALGKPRDANSAFRRSVSEYFQEGCFARDERRLELGASEFLLSPLCGLLEDMPQVILRNVSFVRINLNSKEGELKKNENSG